MEIKIIPLKDELIDYIERLFVEYQSKKDIISTIFEMHKFDEDNSIIESEPFKHYEKLFEQAKVAYDTCMKSIEDEYIPAEINFPSTRFEVDFKEKVLKIYVKEA